LNGPEIFIASSCVQHQKIKNSVLELAEEGFTSIELSGGTDYYSNYQYDLLKLQDKYSINYTIHNYFPPPREHFMLNLSSLDDALYQKSIEHCVQAINLCKKLGSKKYGVHAGFLIDFLPSEAGKKISLKRINNLQDAYRRFNDAWSKLKNHAGSELDLYVENNVFSKSNLETYQQDNPFLFTDYQSWLEFSNNVESKLLLDFAHLKVSCKSLGLDFNKEVSKLVSLTDYYHISGNDGLHDQNQSISNDNEIITVLGDYSWQGKTFTIEVYESINSLHENFDFLQNKLVKK
jgi:sugar phosphate isomerase/epimerase